MAQRSIADSVFSWAKLIAFLSLVGYLVYDYTSAGRSPFAGMTLTEKAAYCDGAQAIVDKVHRFLRCMKINSFEIAGIGAEVDYAALIEQGDEAAEAVGLINSALERAERQDNEDLVAILTDARDRGAATVQQIEETARVFETYSKAPLEVTTGPGEEAVLASPPGSPEWVLVAGADKTLADARNQLAAVGRVVGQEPVLLRRGDFYRTSVIYPDRASAQEAYDRFEPQLKYGAILRDLSTFCPAPVEQRQGGERVLLCTGS